MMNFLRWQIRDKKNALDRSAAMVGAQSGARSQNKFTRKNYLCRSGYDDTYIHQNVLTRPHM